jgi:hypothetical protein
MTTIGACTHKCAMLPSREDCTEDCHAARDAAAHAAHLLATKDPDDTYWVLEFWLRPSPPGELRLAPAGTYPAGRVPAAFRARWWREVERAAGEMAEELGARLT